MTILSACVKGKITPSPSHSSLISFWKSVEKRKKKHELTVFILFSFLFLHENDNREKKEIKTHSHFNFYLKYERKKLGKVFLNKNFLFFFQKWGPLSSPTSIFPFHFEKEEMSRKSEGSPFVLFSSFFLSERERELGRKKNEISLFSLSFPPSFFRKWKQNEDGARKYACFISIHFRPPLLSQKWKWWERRRKPLHFIFLFFPFWKVRRRRKRRNDRFLLFLLISFFLMRSGRERKKKRARVFRLLLSWLTVAISFDFILYSPFLREVGRKVMTGNNIVIGLDFVFKTVFFFDQLTIFFSKKIKF